MPEETPAEQPRKESKAVVFQDREIQIDGKTFRLMMNTVVAGDREDMLACGLRPE